VTDFVMVLNNDAAVHAFFPRGNVTIGVDVSAAAGPVGRTAAGAVMPTAAFTPIAGAKASLLACHWKAQWLERKGNPISATTENLLEPIQS